MPSDITDVDAECEAICESAAEAGAADMLGMCGNAGQETIITNALDDYFAAAMECASGDPSDFSTDHDEAVGEIVDVGNAYLEEAASECQDLRDAVAAGDLSGL